MMSLRNFFDEDDFLFSPFGRAVQRSNESSQWTFPRTDVSESETAVKICSEIPGMKKEDVHIEVDEQNKVVTFSGESKQEKKEDGENYHRVERRYGKFKRSFQLPHNAKLDEIKAQMNHGILEIQIPKVKKEETLKKINIQ